MKATACIFTLGLATLAPLSGADTFVLPHVLEKSGRIVGVAWNPTGGHPSIAIDEGGAPKVKRKPTTMLFSLYGNDDIFAWLLAGIQGKTSTAAYAMYSVQKGARTVNGPRSVAIDDALWYLHSRIQFPACDADSKEPAGVTVDVDADFSTPKPADPTDAQKDAVKRQKLWMCSNFRFTVDGASTKDVTKVSAITMRFPKLAAPPEMDDFSFTLPASERAVYDEDLAKALAGSPVIRRATIQYLDDDGLPLLTMIIEFSVNSVAPANSYVEPLDGPVRIGCKTYTGHVTVIK